MKSMILKSMLTSVIWYSSLYCNDLEIKLGELKENLTNLKNYFQGPKKNQILAKNAKIIKDFSRALSNYLSDENIKKLVANIRKREPIKIESKFGEITSFDNFLHFIEHYITSESPKLIEALKEINSLDLERNYALEMFNDIEEIDKKISDYTALLLAGAGEYRTSLGAELDISENYRNRLTEKIKVIESTRKVLLPIKNEISKLSQKFLNRFIFKKAI